MKELQILNEYTFSRVYDRLKISTAAMITAYRCSNSKNKNERKQTLLKKDLKALGYSYNEFNGYYIEFDSDEKPVLEKSLLVFTDNLKNFKENIVELGVKYQQDTILIINNGQGILIGTTGNDPNFPKGKKLVLER